VKIKTLLLAFLLLLCFFTIAQSSPHYFIGTKEFANTDVYSLLYDEQNDLIYAATNRGVYCYQENVFKEISQNTKQVGSSFFQLKKNHKGEIFCGNLTGQIFKIKDYKLDLFYQLPSTSTAERFNFFFDNYELIIYNSGELFKIKASGKKAIIFNKKTIQDLYTNKKTDDFYARKICQLPNGKIYFPLNRSSLYLTYKNGKLAAHKTPNHYSFEGFVNFFILEDQVLFESNHIYKTKDSNYISHFSLEEKSIVYQFDSNSILFASPNEGVSILELENNIITKQSLGFHKSFISAITQNKNGTLFFGTFKDGIIVVPNRKIIKYDTHSNLTGIISSPNNEIFLSDIKKNLYWHNKKLEFLSLSLYNKDHLIYLKGTYYVNSHRFHGIFNPNKKVDPNKSIGSNVKDSYEFKNNLLFLISPSHIDIVLADTTKYIHSCFANKIESSRYKISLKDRGKSILFHETDSSLYYSTIKNVYIKKWNLAKTETILFQGKSILGNDLTSYGPQIIIGTEANGLLFYHKRKLIKQISTTNGLLSNTIIKVEIKDNLLFIITTKGLQVYDLLSETFIGLGESEGVNSEKVYNFSISNDKIWLLDKEGYYAIKLNNICDKDKFSLGKVYMQSIFVNDVQSDTSKKEYSYSDNNFQFFFDYRNFKTKREAKYFYKLDGANNEWRSLSTSLNSINFPSLSPGEYLFSIKVVYRNQETETVQYGFTIKQPFWNQIWFILLCFVILILLISLVFFFRNKRKEKDRIIESNKQKLESDIIESKLKAIRSQMNPHFIFNSLNSIQALVLKENKALSYDSIEQFSDLVRKTLHFSEKNLVPINEEMSFLQIYLELESLRMKDDFTFTLKNEYSRNLNIPSLLIQPFIENSIHHGLLHKEGLKKLDITFYKENNETYCSIVDNGIGRVEAREINKRQNNMHESFSLNALKDRLKILSQQHSEEYNYIITDLYNELNQPIGTKVVVHFPFQDEY
jgi:hypothetical protein